MTALTFEQLERVYEELAQSIDRVRPQDERVFLAKLALALAHRLGDAAIFSACVQTALQDLEADGGAGAARD